MNKIILQNGIDVDPLYKGKILMSNVYEGKELLVNVSVGTSDGGQLLAQEYHYKVVADCEKYIDLQGDTATQLADFTITTMTDQTKLNWKLYTVGTTRHFELWLGDKMVAYGTKVNNGVINFESTSEIGISGSVNVTYTAQDSDPGNIIYIYRNVVIQSEDLTITPSDNLLTAEIQMQPIIGDVRAVYLYRGEEEDEYDGYFLNAGGSITTAIATFSDDGTVSFDYDTNWDAGTLVVTRMFLPEGKINGVPHPCKSMLGIRQKDDAEFTYIDCNKVINKPNWHGTTEPYNTYAFKEFTSWLT